MRFFTKISQIIILVLVPILIKAQSKDIRFHLLAINEETGTIVNNCEFKVYLEPLGAILDLSKDKKSIFYKVQPDQQFKVVAFAPGFYTEEKVFNTSDFFDEDNLQLSLHPKQGNQAVLKVIDAISAKNIEATIEFTNQNKSVSAKLSDKTPFYNYDFNESQKVTLTVSSKNHETKTMDFNLIANETLVKTLL